MEKYACLLTRALMEVNVIDDLLIQYYIRKVRLPFNHVFKPMFETVVIAANGGSIQNLIQIHFGDTIEVEIYRDAKQLALCNFFGFCSDNKIFDIK